MLLIKLLLALSALYCGGMWVYYASVVTIAWKRRGDVIDMETETFHLGLCFLIAIGFLGLLIK